MAQVVVLGLQGEDGLWVADLANGTVTPLEGDLAAGRNATSGLHHVEATKFKGVDYAVAIPTADPIASGHLDR